jgi:hypothetical protein
MKKRKKTEKCHEAYQLNKIIKEAKKPIMPSKDSIVIVNHAYIAKEEEVGTSIYLKCKTKKACDERRKTNISTSL